MESCRAGVCGTLHVLEGLSAMEVVFCLFFFLDVLSCPSRVLGTFIMASWLHLWTFTFIFETVGFPLDPQQVKLFAEGSTTKT